MAPQHQTIPTGSPCVTLSTGLSGPGTPQSVASSRLAIQLRAPGEVLPRRPDEEPPQLEVLRGVGILPVGRGRLLLGPLQGPVGVQRARLHGRQRLALVVGPFGCRIASRNFRNRNRILRKGIHMGDNAEANRSRGHYEWNLDIQVETCIQEYEEDMKKWYSEGGPTDPELSTTIFEQAERYAAHVLKASRSSLPESGCTHTPATPHSRVRWMKRPSSVSSAPASGQSCSSWPRVARAMPGFASTSVQAARL